VGIRVKHTKKVYIGSFSKARIQIRIPPKRCRSGSATLLFSGFSEDSEMAKYLFFETKLFEYQ
jgi:hypothetical protein